MVLESALLHVKPGQEAAFEAAFGEARHIIGAMQGFISLTLSRCAASTSASRRPISRACVQRVTRRRS